MPTTPPWKPVLTGEEAALAEQAVLRIANDLGDERWAPERMYPGLSGGNAGFAIFYHVLAQRWPDSGFGELRDRYWDASIEGLAQTPNVPPSLYGGFTGVGWATLWLASMQGDTAQLDEVHEELEETLLECLGSIQDPSHYDLILGPTGWALYALERWPHPRATRALEMIVDYFEQRAERVENGIRWHTPPQLLPQWQREKAPNGYDNLGIAHGIPGVWVLLAHTIVRGIRTKSSAALLEGAVRWVLSQQWREGSILTFPGWIQTEEQEPPGNRLAWCYGDLGVAAALLVAGQLTERSEWTREAVAIARRAVRISREVSGHRDAGLCHGSAGVGHIFGRFYQTTGDRAFGDAAAYWLRVALDMCTEGIGPGGYAAWRQIPTPGWDPTPGLLEGATGIGLALLAGTSDRDPTWDRFLSISAVPMSAAKLLAPSSL